MKQWVFILLIGAVMTTYNTGNAVGSTDPRDLSDNALNFDKAVNSTEQTFLDRLGQPRLTIAGMVAAATTGNPAVGASQEAIAAAQEAVSAAEQSVVSASEAQSALSQIDQALTGAAEQAAAAATAIADDAASRAAASADAAQLSAGVYPSTSAGISATTSGQYFSVPSANSAEYLILYLNNSGTASEIKRYPSASIDALTVNQTKVYPERSISRAGTVSAVRTYMRAALLDVEVIGARSGKYYRLAFFKNGTTALTGPSDGWIIEEHDAASYTSGPESKITVVNYTDAAPDIPRSGIQTVRIYSPVIAGLSFRITLDTAALPAYGTQISGNTSSQAGWSDIIDPSRYKDGSTATSGQASAVLWSTDDQSNVFVSWASKGYSYRVKFGPVGVNGLPNLAQTWIATGTDLASAEWTSLMNTGSDHLPPLQVEAVNNGDGAAVAFTGGSHGSNGDATGTATARNMLFQVLIDGSPTVAGRSGYAGNVSLNIINEVQAYNTRTAGRHVVRQSFVVEFSPAGMTVTADLTAIEPVRVRTDYALQSLTTSFQDTQLVLGGANTQRVAYITTANDSGAKSSRPNAWAAVFQSPTNGQMALWMDKTYEAGDGRHVDDTQPLVFGSSLSKWYLGVVRSAAGVTLSAGGGYKYRAGISWQGPGIQPSGYDSIVGMRLNGIVRFAYGLPDASFVRL